MDLPAIFQRAPELALIDELAHTNAPGLEHHKRYEDIEDILDAGIDVYSTVNVQHLESLNDRVAELTGVRVRETFPDTVLKAADEVVLIDLTPEALIERLRAGKIYPAERVERLAQQLLPDREPRDAAGARPAPDRRGGRGEGAPRRDDEPLGTREQVIEPSRRRRSASGCWPWSQPRRELAAAGAARLALGPAARRRARPALRRCRPAPSRRRGARAARGAAAGWPRCSGRG